ncbi:farnesyl pyrophosphate synthetase, putative [Babesia bigemina]|uniref:Farnesyl pyrophosphate synthetase, putative n=1 Tax=Babesia bigemina TaxID=5866 RepID=A0A061D6N7_BABBI|nr:farnesyl pyrophosphate synthetase, putative [Babesia bigemina]CDR96218.1 farnesyl pyrophosphate synthetase, putative [Babesia bigemina]|eukprot:XP_012768404.1 farnesyl pyrophosphate synthetase, putative [Babesia bigemina]
MIAYNTCSPPNFVSYCNDRLRSFLPVFLDIATAEIKSYDISDDDLAYYSNAIQYNLQGGKLIRGTLVVLTTRSLLGDGMTEHYWHEALVLGWCVELLQTAFLVADDIMDKSIMRRSNVCWYMVPTVGISNAVNDTMFLNTLVHRIIANQLKDSKHLVTVMNLFTEVSMITILGQHMDTYDAMDASVFDTPTGATSLYYRICKNKTAYYTFFLPMKLGMIISGIDQGNINYSKLESVSSLLGHLFQAQDDYLDCYSDPGCSGKEGTDIQTKKCTWLLATAIHVGDKSHLQTIKENIGKDNKDNVEVVKKIYNDLKLPHLFKVYTQDLKCNIQSQINDIGSKGRQLECAPLNAQN